MDTTRKRYDHIPRNRAYRQERASDSKSKRPPLSAILTRQIAICLIIGGICLGITSIDTPQTQAATNAVKYALTYSIDVNSTWESMKSTYRKIVKPNEDIDDTPVVSLPADAPADSVDQVKPDVQIQGIE